MTEEIRRILRENARLSTDVDTLSDDADLYQAGMTSHASVNVMLALEDAFDVEFPDEMLTRDVFASIAAIRSAVASPSAVTAAIERPMSPPVPTSDVTDAIRRCCSQTSRR